MFTRYAASLPIVSFFRRSELRLEMLVVLSVKLALIFVLWKAFFSHPTAKHLSHEKLTAHFVALKV